VLAGLAGAFSYGVATCYARRAPAVEPFDNALGSMLAATIVMLPLALAGAAPQPIWDWRITVSVLLLGIVSTGAAYLLYFRLIQDIGPPAALTVTFLIPLFGSLWGVLLLGESIGWHTLAGGAAVIAGTALASGLVPSRLQRSPGR
jgi:drug/metabolite transporter (DMT)-like permease